MLKEPILISCCLLKVPCRYDGQVAERTMAEALLEDSAVQWIPVCPEQLGGLATPRPPVEIVGGDGYDVLDGLAQVQDRSGGDFSNHFINGAEAVLRIARVVGAVKMVTQKRSPSCSCARIYDGTFSRQLITGWGVTAAFLKRNGLTLIDIDVYEKEVL